MTPYRTLIHGDKKAGFTVFWADDGLDTGPILLQRECDVEPDETVNTIYKRFLFPEGVKGTVSQQWTMAAFHLLLIKFKLKLKLNLCTTNPTELFLLLSSMD